MNWLKIEEEEEKAFFSFSTALNGKFYSYSEVTGSSWWGGNRNDHAGKAWLSFFQTSSTLNEIVIVSFNFNFFLF